MPSMSIATVAGLTLMLAAAGLAQAQEPYKQAIAPREWSFPQDHGRHDGFKTEWWYFTGNLRDPAGQVLGYQVTFFRTAFTPEPTTRPSAWGMTDLYFAHAAISDVTHQQFVFKDRLQRSRPGLAWASEKTLDVVLLDWTAKLEDKTIRLRCAEPGFAIDLSLTDGRGPFLEGPGGVNPKGRQPGQASYYYSMTRLKTTGKLTIPGVTYEVTGQTWMDHEFSSNSLSPEQVGWDWMGLQLSDGTDLMIYRLRNKAQAADYLSGTQVGGDHVPHYLSAKDISIEGSDPWKSPASGGSYPQRWRVGVKGLGNFTVSSEMPGQELITSTSTKVTYFEGAAQVKDQAGKSAGEGYLEMTGYAQSLGGSF